MGTLAIAMYEPDVTPLMTNLPFASERRWQPGIGPKPPCADRFSVSQSLPRRGTLRINHGSQHLIGLSREKPMTIPVAT